MKEISIRQLEDLSQIRAHTIRIWENRYALFKPGRSTGNIRFYSVNDLSRLFNISFLNKAGTRISRLASLDEQEIEQMMASYTDTDSKLAIALNRLVIHMYAGSIEKFEEVLNDCQAEMSLDVTVRHLIFPFLKKVNLLSYKDRSNETHFVVTAIRRKIIHAVEAHPQLPAPAKSALLFLPEGEHFDLVLLYISYVLKIAGVKVFYLGTNVPDQNIQSFALSHNPDSIYLYLPPKRKYSVAALNSMLSKQVPGLQLFVVTPMDHDSDDNSLNNVKFINFNELHDHV